MKKRILMLSLCLLLCVSLALPVFAGEPSQGAEEYGYMLDYAGLLTEEQAASLETTLEEISLRQECDVIILTVEMLGDYDHPTPYADDFFDYNGFGQGSDRSGILFLISLLDREWAFSTRGYGITAFTDDVLQELENTVSASMRAGNYNAAFCDFASESDRILTESKEPINPVIVIGGCLLAAILLAFIVLGAMKSKLKSVRPQGSANSYVRENSMQVTKSMDIFIGSAVTRTEKPRNNGGSTTHTSSSGATHGGSSGKF